MAQVNLVKSIYTGVDVTSLGELASGDTVVIPNGSELGTPLTGTLTNCTGLPLTTGVTGTLGAANGGTGQTSYAVGDLLYASGATALSTLADVATGNALISGGVGVAPAWGKVGLTTHISGTLAVGNGGTGATTLTGVVKGNGTSAFTAGTVSLTSEVTGTLPVANGGTGVTSSTGSGSVVLSTSPSLTTPNIGTPSAGTLTNCTVDGTNAVGYRSIPPVGTKTSSYTLQTADIGKYVQVGSGGSIVIPDAVFSEGNAISVFNNTTGSITITC